MKIEIDRIKVDETTRIRQDIGDLDELQKSISEVGLISPILVDEQNRLIAGYRRLSACKNLEWKEIEVNVVELEDDELKMLEAEAAENLFRKDFTPEEILAIQKRRDEIAEARRPKGIFERFWNWLKALFASKPQPETQPEPAAETPAPDAPPQDQVTPEPAAETPAPDAPQQAQAAQEPADPPSAENSTEAAPVDDEQVDSPPEAAVAAAAEKTSPAAEQEVAASIPKQPSSAEIVEENGVRHIKWR